MEPHRKLLICKITASSSRAVICAGSVLCLPHTFLVFLSPPPYTDDNCCFPLASSEDALRTLPQAQSPGHQVLYLFFAYVSVCGGVCVCSHVCVQCVGTPEVDHLSLIRRTLCWKERTDSCKLSRLPQLRHATHDPPLQENKCNFKN